MTTLAKGMIITGVVLVLLVVVGLAGGVYWISRQTGPLMAKSKEAMEEGQRFGASTDNAGCVTQTTARYKKEPGFTAAITGRLFLEGCLRASHASEGFCDNVPGATEFMKAAEWQRDRCSEAGLAGDTYCPQLFSSVQTFCERKRNGPRSESGK